MACSLTIEPAHINTGLDMNKRWYSIIPTWVEEGSISKGINDAVRRVLIYM